MKAKRIALNAVLTAIALTVYIIEQLIPLPLPVPGVKLGLSNIVTLFAMFALSPIDAAVILVARILLGSLFSGRITSLLYSAVGGILCYLATLLLKKIITEKQIWVCGVVGAIAHNVGQISVAALLTGSAAIFAYLPVLIAFAVVTGTATGLTAQLSVLKTQKVITKFKIK